MLDRKTTPDFYIPDNFHLTQAQTTPLKGGIPLHVIDAGDQSICRLEVIFKAGKWYETKTGVSFFTSKMMLEGTRSYSADDINRLFEKLGAYFDISPGQDLVTLTVYFLNKHVDRILELVAEILTAPAFPEENLDVLKSIQKQTLQVNLEKNNFVATRKFRQTIFGPDHPYGNNIEPNDIQHIQTPDLSEHFNYYMRHNFEVVLSGKVSEIEINVSRFFDQFKVTAHDQRPGTFPKSPAGGNEVHVEKANSLQSSLRIGKTTILKSDPDYVKALIANEVYGGYFGSRLMQKLREEKGYTYGVHSSIANNIQDSYFIIGTDVIKASWEDALSDIKHEWQRIYDMDHSEEELGKVKNYFKGSFLSSISNPLPLPEKLNTIHFHGLDYAFYDTLFAKIDDVSLDDVKTVFLRHLNIDEMSIVRVG